MELEDTAVNNNRKRARGDESDSDSPELKLVRVDSVGLAADLVEDRRELEVSGDGRVDSGANSPAARGFQEDDIFGGMLDGPEDEEVQGLDFVMRSLEEEILAPATEVSPEGEPSLPELGYLLEASDDELGLPPAGYSGEESAGFSGLDVAGGFGFDGEFPSYDSFELELVGESVVNGGDEFVSLGGLFDHSDDGFGTEDGFGAVADVSLSAL